MRHKQSLLDCFFVFGARIPPQLENISQTAFIYLNGDSGTNSRFRKKKKLKKGNKLIRETFPSYCELIWTTSF
jgi:hypothetical protein